ncbi:response regulator [Shewanella woodyi]|uniref:response regulator n=1 Tax=Shewanella woodyi TaxID=60961 RepID=UPI0007EAFDFB|nr:response regulator [Shewanella woodyi]
MKQAAKILVVDDTAVSRLMLRGILEDKYDISEAESGEECLAIIDVSIPDLVLLDVDMPGMSGFEVCVALRREIVTAHLPIIFVSGLDTVEERLTGYEAGADEYITKPAEPEELHEKVGVCLSQHLEISHAKDSASEAMAIAMEAMTVSSELGQVVQFIKDVQSIERAEDVGMAMNNILLNFGMHAVSRVDTGDVVFVGCKKESIEAELLTRFVYHNERILSIGIRTIIRDPHIVLLIKDMPLDDEKRCGRLRDHLAVLMDIANVQLANLAARAKMLEQRQEIFTQVISMTEKQIQQTSERLITHEESSQGVMRGMLTELEGMLFGLGLEEDQEKQLIALADETSTKLEASQGQGELVNKELGAILECLYKFFNTLNESREQS